MPDIDLLIANKNFWLTVVLPAALLGIFYFAVQLVVWNRRFLQAFFKSVWRKSLIKCTAYALAGAASMAVVCFIGEANTYMIPIAAVVIGLIGFTTSAEEEWRTDAKE